MINWLLYIALCGYNALDVYQTQMLFDCGAVEANLLLLLFMETPTDIQPIIIIKVIFLGFLGIFLYIHNKRKKK